MSPRDWQIRIHDILSSIKAIQNYISGMTYEEFCSDSKTMDAVLHNLAIIGEAANHIPEESTIEHDVIPWREMRGIRNVVAHEYFGISSRIVWDTAFVDLPRILPLLENILKPEN